MISEALPVFTILLFIIYLSEVLARRTILKYLGAAMLVIILGAIASNTQLIPAASDSIPLYDDIFSFVVPLALIFLLLDVDLRSLGKAGLPMLILFLIGALATAIGAFISIQLLGGKEIFGSSGQAIAGMFTGTYIGGSINFNAVGFHYDIQKDPALFAGSVAVDNIITSIWMLVCITLPTLLRALFKSAKFKSYSSDKHSEKDQDEERLELSVAKFALLILLVLIIYQISDLITNYLEECGMQIPFILILTTISLILAQVPAISALKGKQFLGLFLLYLFLAVIGAYCEFSILWQMGNTAWLLLSFASMLVLVHGTLIFILGGLLRYDWKMISIASQANVGGQATAISLAKSFNRSELILPALLIGSLGNALGTYLGFLVAGIV